VAEFQDDGRLRRGRAGQRDGRNRGGGNDEISHGYFSLGGFFFELIDCGRQRPKMRRSAVS
jgi:hypothetical protein